MRPVFFARIAMIPSISIWRGGSRVLERICHMISRRYKRPRPYEKRPIHVCKITIALIPGLA